MFRFVRTDVDMVVLSNKYLDELRSLPETIISPTKAHEYNLNGRYTRTNIILESNLHFRLLQTRLTPNLGSMVMRMRDEMEFAMKTDFPNCKDDWIAIKPYHDILRIVARISARVFLGLPFCRNEEWLETSVEYTENVFVTVVVMRLFPPWLHPLISLLLPARYRLQSYVNTAMRLLVPEVKRRREAWDRYDGVEARQNLLSWMIETANEKEGRPDKLAHLELVISLASIHTTQMAVVHVLYDLCEHPEFLPELRDEIEEVLAQDGEWKKTSFTKLRKLDSFMKESQRFNPPSILAFHRVALERVKLHDGSIIPKGTHFCMPCEAIQNDPAVTPYPEVFDGLRYYKYRENPEEAQQHQFATTEPNMLNFGHGKYSCPGRFFASLEIKNILVRLLTDYDFKFPEGKGRPDNLRAYEYIFPNPDGQLLFKERMK